MRKQFLCCTKSTKTMKHQRKRGWLSVLCKYCGKFESTMEYRGVQCCEACYAHHIACESAAESAYRLQNYRSKNINFFDSAKEQYQHKWEHIAKQIIKKSLVEAVKRNGTKSMKVSYKGVTGKPLKVELSTKYNGFTYTCGLSSESELLDRYSVEILDESNDAHIRFGDADLKDIMFIGVTVMIDAGTQSK